MALTLDACMGKTDMRILTVLVAERIPATIFVTADTTNLVSLTNGNMFFGEQKEYGRCLGAIFALDAKKWEWK